MKFPIIKILLVTAVLTITSYFIFTLIGLSLITATSGVLIATLIAASIMCFSSNDDAQENVEVRTLYVGNLPYRANEGMIKELFSLHGYVQSVRLMKDKKTGKRRGFGFVEIAAHCADNAIAALNDTEYQQRTLKVREAKDKPE